MSEFCLLETFRPQCWKNEVVVMKEAIYGRRHIGKCIELAEVEGVEDDPRYLGCHANVLSLLDTKCSGKKQCEVHVPDADLQRTQPCRKGLMLFLEVKYTCVEGTADLQSTNFSLNNMPKSHVTYVGLNITLLCDVYTRIQRTIYALDIKVVYYS